MQVDTSPIGNGGAHQTFTTTILGFFTRKRRLITDSMLEPDQSPSIFCLQIEGRLIGEAHRISLGRRPFAMCLTSVSTNCTMLYSQWDTYQQSPCIEITFIKAIAESLGGHVASFCCKYCTLKVCRRLVHIP